MSAPKINVHPVPAELGFETHSSLQHLAKTLVINPLANYMPARLLRSILKFTKSELAQSNWKDPGGWKSMVISYNGNPHKLADKVLVAGGSIPMALRNRKKLGAYLLAQLVQQAQAAKVHVLCLGAGPGQIIMDAMQQADKPVYATLVDINADAFEFGTRMAAQRGLSDSVRYIQCDIRDIQRYLDQPPDIVKMLGICEYISDEQLLHIASSAAQVMPAGSAILFNTLNYVHGTDRFFRRVFGLHMIHRDCRQLAELMAQAGFSDFTVHTEPLGVYDLLVARKADAVATPSR